MTAQPIGDDLAQRGTSVQHEIEGVSGGGSCCAALQQATTLDQPYSSTNPTGPFQLILQLQ